MPHVQLISASPNTWRQISSPSGVSLRTWSVLVGGVPASQVVVVDANTIRCKTPAHVAGPKSVVLRDRCGQDTMAPGTFTYGTGLFVTTIRPDSVPVFGGVPVLVQGSNLSAGDTVYLDDVPVADVKRFETELLEFMRSGHGSLLDAVKTGGVPDELGDVISRFKEQFVPSSTEQTADPTATDADELGAAQSRKTLATE